MDLFLTPKVELEKVAAEASLSEDPNQWPNEILQELYKQVPYISDFEPKIVMDRVDGERGFGFGHVEVANKTEAPTSATPESTEAAGIQTVRIPIVVREGKLQPLDILVTADSKMLPLTENRLRQAIFRPQMFDITSKTPGDMSMIGQLYPPHRSNFGYGGAGVAFGAEGLGKTGSALEAYLEKEAGLMSRAKAIKDRVVAAARDAVEKGKGAVEAVKEKAEAVSDTAGKVHHAVRSGAEAVEQMSDAAKDVAAKTRSSAAHMHTKVTGRPVEDTTREMAQQSTVGTAEGIGKGLKELVEKHPKVVGGAAATAVGLGALHHGVKHGLERKRQKSFAKDLAKAIHGEKEEHHKKAEDLTATSRDKIKEKNFAIPDERKYPVHDKDHAENALSRVAQHGSPSEKAKVYAAVAKKFPELAAKSSVPEVKEKAKESSWLGDIRGGNQEHYEAAANAHDAALKAGKSGREAAAVFDKVLEQRLKKHASILDSILPTINEEDYEKFASRFVDDNLRAAYLANHHATAPALQKLATYQGWSVTKVAHGILNSLRPSVMQITKTAGGYTVKSASHNLWAPKEEVIDRGQLVKMAGVKVALDVDLNKTVTMADGAGVDRDLPEDEHAEQVKDFGIWKVQTLKGDELIGYVFPTLLDLDGQQVPIALFTNGSQSALQADMAGVKVGEGASLFEGPPDGKGIFFKVLDTGRAVGTVPVTIHAKLQNQGSPALMAESFDGSPVQIVIQPGVEIPSLIDGTAIIPDDWSWMPLERTEAVQLVERVDQMHLQDVARKEACAVTIKSTGADSFSVTGMLLDKLGHDQTELLTHDEAVFLLGGLGVAPAYAQEKLACAYHWQQPTQCRVGRTIETVVDNANIVAEKTASTLANYTNLRRDLVKEAAFIPDPTSVDTVLSLGFINPENVNTFVESLPAIDESQQKLAELLLASRLGLKDVPSAALERALRSTEEVYDGLKTLAFAK